MAEKERIRQVRGKECGGVVNSIQFLPLERKKDLAALFSCRTSGPYPVASITQLGNGLTEVEGGGQLKRGADKSRLTMVSHSTGNS